MANLVNDSKIVIPLVPTFLHLALVKVAIPLFYKYGSEKLKAAMTEIQLQNLPASHEGIRKKRKLNYTKEQEALLFIPAHLRQSVLEAVNGIEWEVGLWQSHHWFLRLEDVNTKCGEENIIYWKSDGTVNRNETARKLVQNKNISIDVKFKIACIYCFKDRIKTLWAEMMRSGKTKNFDIDDNSIENGWIEWICCGNSDDWTHAVIRQSRVFPSPRYSSFFSSLHPEDRKKVVTFLACRRSNLNDLRSCIYAMTKEEQEEIAKKDVLTFLSLFAQWPSQNSFLETVEKVKNYIDYDIFISVLTFIMIRKAKKDFDYRKLIVGFCNINPDHYKKLLTEKPYCSYQLQQYIKGNMFP